MTPDHPVTESGGHSRDSSSNNNNKKKNQINNI